MSDEHIKVVIDGDSRKLAEACAAASAEIRGIGKATKDTSRDTNQLTKDLDGLNGAAARINRQFALTKNIMGALKLPAMVAGFGMLTKEIGALGAGAVSMTSALAPATGALELYAAGAATAGQALGTVKLASQGVGDALKAQAAAHQAASGTAQQQQAANQKLAQSMKALPPAAREFVKVIDEQRGRLGTLQRTAAGGLFPGVTAGLKEATGLLPEVKTAVGETARELGHLADEAGRLVGSRGFGQDFAKITHSNVQVLDDLGHAGLSLAQALTDVMVAARPFNEWVSGALRDGAAGIERWAAAGRKTGDTARFFHEAEIALTHLWGIASQTVGALLNIGKAGYSTGRGLVAELDDVTKHWEKWTGSLQGQKTLKAYFEESRPAVEETGRLVRDLVKALFRVGNQDGTAKLVHQLRVELLPALEQLVTTLTGTFGPALIDALSQFAQLFADLSAGDGGLTLAVTALGKIAGLLDDLIDSSSVLKSTLTVGLTGFSLYKLLGIGTAIKGIKDLVGWLGKTKLAAAEVAAVNAAGGVAGAPGVAAGRGGLGGAAKGASGAVRGLSAGLNALPIVGAVGLGIYAAAEPAAGNSLNEKLKGNLQLIRDYQAALAKLKGVGAHAAIDRLRSAMEQLQAKGNITSWSREQRQAFGQLVNRSSDLADGMKGAQDAIDALARGGASSIRNLRANVAANTQLIKARLGDDTAEGKKALADNFHAAVTAVRHAMADGTIATQKGLGEINRLMRQALAVYGITGKQATRYLNNQDTIRGTPLSGGNEGSNTPIGKQRGGHIDMGAPTGDTVPAMLERDEYVLNRNAVAALGGPGVLDQINFGMAPRFQKGGIVQLGRRLQRIPYVTVSENPAFGGVHPVHTPGSLHYSGQALDVNADAAPQGEGAVLDGVAAMLKRLGWHVLWRVAGHFDHLHVDTASGGAAMAARQIRTPGWTGPGGALGQVGRGALAGVTRAANQKLASLADTLGGETGGDRGGADPAVIAAFRRAAGTRHALPIERLALFEAGLVESGLRNLSYGDADSVGALQQRPSQGWTGLRNPYRAALEFLARAVALRPWKGTAGQLAQAIQRSAYPGRYDQVAGQARRYMQRGGTVGKVRGTVKRGLGTRHKGPKPFTQQLKRIGLVQVAQADQLGTTITDKETAYGLVVRADDQTLEEPTRTLPDGTEVVNQDGYTRPGGIFIGGITQHVAELNHHMQLKEEIRGLLEQRRQLLADGIRNLYAGLKVKTDRLKALRDRLKANNAEIGRLNDDLRDVNRDLQKPGLSAQRRADLQGRRGRITHRLGELGAENRAMRPEITRLTGEVTAWTTAKDDAEQAIKTLTLSDLPTVDLDLGDIRNELQAWGADAVAGTITPASGSGSGAAELLALVQQQLDNERRANYLQGLHFQTLRGLGGLVQGRVLGSFLHGGNVPATGLYLLHQGETVKTNPDGAFGDRTAQPAPAPTVNVQVYVAADGTARAVVDGRDVPVSVQQGRMARLLTVAPGR